MVLDKCCRVIQDENSLQIIKMAFGKHDGQITIADKLWVITLPNRNYNCKVCVKYSKQNI
jgi:hypothetical protein